MENLKKGDWAILEIQAKRIDFQTYIIYHVIELLSNGCVRVFGYDRDNKFAGEYVCGQQTLKPMERTIRRCMVCKKEVMYLFTVPYNYSVTFTIYLENIELPIGREYRCKKHPAILKKEDAKRVTASQLKTLNPLLDKYKKRVLNVCMIDEGNLIVDIKLDEVDQNKYPFSRLCFGRRGVQIYRDMARDYDYKKKELIGGSFIFNR